MSFWESELGTITGKPEDAFQKSFDRIPNNSFLLATITNCFWHETSIESCIRITWTIEKGDFKGRFVNQNIHVLSSKPETKHRALNMLALLYKTFQMKAHDSAPTDENLNQFVGKKAGIKVLETKPNDKGYQYNYVGEVHSVMGFQESIGTPLVVDAPKKQDGKNAPFDLDDAIPF